MAKRPTPWVWSHDDAEEAQQQRARHQAMHRQAAEQQARTLHEPAPESAQRLASCIFPTPGQPLDSFFEEYPPSRTSSGQAHWLGVRSPNGQPTGHVPNTTALLQAWQGLVASEAVSVDAIRALALHHGVVAGNWCYSASHAEVDAVWKLLASATAHGHLGTACKVATGCFNKTHLITVTTWSFLDTPDVLQVRQRLRQLGLAQPITYQPEVYQYLGIHHGGRWGIPTALFTE
eukprot:TRINITY_DN33011_c0_g1_i1.p1 TRINITY_DN33011_c0_g1~~TRINITY_DN33011_c0_g1_i1.p1  ORF type:complete len:233 (-),score=26.51 TRINITY_DN33011_c0_g1_i1:107-805(-)